MDDIIKRIVDIENSAIEAENDILRLKSKSEIEMREESEKLEDEILQKANARIEHLKQLEAEETRIKINEIDEETKKLESALIKRFNENKDMWREKIVKNIMGGV